MSARWWSHIRDIDYFVQVRLIAGEEGGRQGKIARERTKERSILIRETVTREGEERK